MVLAPRPRTRIAPTFPIALRGHAVSHESDELVVALAQDDRFVHLAPSWRPRSLCGVTLRAQHPRTSFRVAGCSRCLASALESGHVAVQETDRTWINLRRLKA